MAADEAPEEGEAAEMPEAEKAPEAGCDAGDPDSTGDQPACAGAAAQPGAPVPATPQERLDEGLGQKERGNEAYREGKYEAAIDSWCMARGTFKHILERGMFDGNEEKLDEVRQSLLTVHLNLAQGSLKNGEFYQAKEHCGRALDLDPKSTKALYRKASAEIMGSLFTEARETLDALLATEPGNAGARQMLQEVDRKEKLADRSSKKAAKRMVAGMARDPRVAVTATDQASSWMRYLLSCRCLRRRKED